MSSYYVQFLKQGRIDDVSPRVPPEKGTPSLRSPVCHGKDARSPAALSAMSSATSPKGYKGYASPLTRYTQRKRSQLYLAKVRPASAKKPTLAPPFSPLSTTRWKEEAHVPAPCNVVLTPSTKPASLWPHAKTMLLCHCIVWTLAVIALVPITEDLSLSNIYRYCVLPYWFDLLTFYLFLGLVLSLYLRRHLPVVSLAHEPLEKTTSTTTTTTSFKVTSTMPRITSPLRISTRSASLSPGSSPSSSTSASPSQEAAKDAFGRYDPISPVQHIHEQRAKLRQHMAPPPLLAKTSRRFMLTEEENDENRPPRLLTKKVSSAARMRQELFEVAEQGDDPVDRTRPPVPPPRSLKPQSSREADTRFRMLNTLKPANQTLPAF